VSSSERPNGEHGDRLVTTLRQLLALEATELALTLAQAADLVAAVLGADKVDVFLHEAEDDCLVALGTSDTRMGRREHELGLDRLPLAEGGQTVGAYRTGRPYLMRRVEDETGELRAITEDLGVRSSMGAPMLVGGARRGVLLAASAQPDRFDGRDLDFLQAVSDWIGLVTHRAELVEQLAARVAEAGFRQGLEAGIELLTKRQREVAGLIAQGKTNAEIAAELVIVEGTVANHVEAILGRLGMRSRTQVGVWAAERGLGRPADGPSTPAET
jgi:DNA-binding CsgD family transcriptional regulator